jgi:signal transduction histidine kinase
VPAEEGGLERIGWEELIAGVREAVVAADAEQRVCFVNPAAERVLGRERAKVEGCALAELLPGEYAMDPPVLTGGWRVERVTEGWAAYGDAMLAAGTGDERVQQLVEAQQLAAVGQIAAGVAHEIGAPLTAISVAVEYLLKSEVDQGSAVSRDLEMILAQTQRIGRLARNLVDLARPGSPVLAPIDLNAVVAEGFELMQRQLRRNGVDASLDLAGSLPPVLGDAHQLQQVLINLVLNAQRSVLSPSAAEKRIEVHTLGTPEANELIVRDFGHGIPSDDLPKIFLPFFSLSGGAGLGLWLARGIVHRHGGTLRVESQLDRGATFVVRLPFEGDER